jgi:hypothetical protein
MIIYRKDKIEAMEVFLAATSWLRRNLISPEEHTAVTEAYAGGYTKPKLLLRIGYFIFACVVISASSGLFYLLFLAASLTSETSIATAGICFGLMAYALAEYHVKTKNTYRSGITHALLCFASGTVLFSIALLIDDQHGNRMWLSFMIASVFLGFIGIRFLSAFFSLASWICFVFACVFGLFQLGKTGMTASPFVCMILSAGFYLYLRNLVPRKEMRFWSGPLHVLEWASLFTFYLSGNYFAVRNLSEGITNAGIPEGGDIPLAFFFYGFTVLVPILYIVNGLRSKNRVFLQCGLITILLSIASIRYYHSFVRADVALTVSGSLLILFAWVFIRFLKTGKAGITSEKPDEEMEAGENHQALLAVSKLIVSKMASETPSGDDSSDPDQISFGGGSGGGSGAGSDF